MLNLSRLFSSYNVVAEEDYNVSELMQYNRPSIVIRFSANNFVRVIELKKGFKLMFKAVRYGRKVYHDMDICQAVTIQKVRQHLDAIKEDKGYGTRLAAQRANPIVVCKVVDKYGVTVPGVDRITKSDMANYSAMGYTFKSYNQSEERVTSIKISGRSKAAVKSGLRKDNSKII